jgi:hypothetical protein
VKNILICPKKEKGAYKSPIVAAATATSAFSELLASQGSIVPVLKKGSIVPVFLYALLQLS